MKKYTQCVLWQYDFSKKNFSSVHGTVNNFCSELCNKSTTQLILHQRYSHSFTPSTRLPGKFSPCFATILRRRENLWVFRPTTRLSPILPCCAMIWKQGGGINKCEYRWRLTQTIKWPRRRRKIWIISTDFPSGMLCGNSESHLQFQKISRAYRRDRVWVDRSRRT